MQKLTPAELEVMQVLWEHGESKPAEIQRAFPRKIKNPALRSVLGILVDKGHVSRRQVGKAFFYQARTGRVSALKVMLRDVADQFCDGSMRTLLFRFVEAEKLTDDDIATLEELAKATPPSTNKRATR